MIELFLAVLLMAVLGEWLWIEARIDRMEKRLLDAREGRRRKRRREGG